MPTHFWMSVYVSLWRFKNVSEHRMKHDQIINNLAYSTHLQTATLRMEEDFFNGWQFDGL